MSEPRGFSMASELRAGGELAALIGDPLYRGQGVPKGDGRLVLVLPGLFANDAYLAPLHKFLLNTGYRPVISRLAVNAGCSDRLMDTARANLLDARAKRKGEPVAIVGHSRGGMLGWALAGELGAEVSHLVLLGSPAPAVAAGLLRRAPLANIGGTGATEFLRGASDRTRARTDPSCTFPNCDCTFRRALEQGPSPSTRLLSIYSTTDRIVPLALSKLPAGAGRNVQVEGTHSGLVYNRKALRALAEELAER